VAGEGIPESLRLADDSGKAARIDALRRAGCWNKSMERLRES